MNGQRDQQEIDRFHAAAAEKATAEKAAGLPSPLAASRALKDLRADGEVFGVSVRVVGDGLDRRYVIAGVERTTVGAARAIIDALK